MRYLLPLVAAAALTACAQTKEATNLAPLSVAFEWSSADKCATSSPAFTVSGVPEGTAKLKFKMTDLDVPSYNHGGGTVAFNGDQIPAGAFTYKGPCPPSGSHDYQWKVEALNAAGDTILGRGEATRPFPPT